MVVLDVSLANLPSCYPLIKMRIQIGYRMKHLYLLGV